MSQPSKSLRLSLFTILAFIIAFAFVFWSWDFTTSRLNEARTIGIFPSPSDGMLKQIQPGWNGIEEVKIVHVAQEKAPGGGPHVWFVIACVWAESRAGGSDLSSQGFDAPGSYFVNIPEGWILMPERFSPLFVGFWVRVFGLQGNDVVEPVHDPSIDSDPMCVREGG